MASADHIKALVTSHASGDQDRFYGVALQVAAKAARQGQRQYAEALRKVVEEARRSEHCRPVASLERLTVAPVAVSETANGLVESVPIERLARSAFVPSVEARLERIILEQRRRRALREHGMVPMQRVLFTGDPGVGKTYAASVVAGELDIPLFVVQLDGLLSRYLGETASRLRLVFEQMERRRGVYFFDEVDAIGGERDGGGDVGEIRRVLNSFLKFLEQDRSDSLLVAATNHPQLLDRAMFRRFDLRIDFPLPDASTLERLLRSRLSVLDTERVDWKLVTAEAEGLSHGEAAKAAEQVAKNAVLAEDLRVCSEQVVRLLQERRQGDGR